ncbi:MAG: hypothetical protein U0946_05490, partial [Patescibacteria group bacterium]|nr:hypothetical protein [Patescibacteria group bacterium]
MNTKITIILIVIVILAGTGFFIYQRRVPGPANPTATNQGEQNAVPSNISSSTTNSPSVTVQQPPI